MSNSCPVCGNALPENSSSCGFCGFKLEGSTERFQPIAFGEEEIVPVENVAPTHTYLRVVRGPQTGAVFELGEGTLSIGRSPHCDIFLNDMTVSREHALLLPQKGKFCIKDSNSFNGVWVNNRNVDQCMLSSGDLIQIGAFCLQYRDE